VTAANDAQLAGELAAAAGELLLVLRNDMGFDEPDALRKEGDRRSHEFLAAALEAALPDDAVLSEEGSDDRSRLAADRVWIVDPLDGTLEFGEEGRTDWAVHVALWQAGRGITDAAVAQPSLDAVYATDDAVSPGPYSGRPVVLVSDSRPPAFAAAVTSSIDGELRTMGSAGAKAMAVVRGEADAYVHAGGQWEWDSAAPVGVARAAGLHCSRIDGSPLVYNQAHPYLPDLVICRREVADSILAAVASAH
jgi:3'(2'), 5'-bisphosphate nucleotidase